MEKRPLSSREQTAIAFFGRYVGGTQAFLYRVSGGRIGASFMGAPVLLLTTTGRKSGRARTSPLLYLRDGERLLLVASKGGFPTHPAWYMNLQQTPEVQVQLGAQRQVMRARTVSEEDKARYWPELVRMYPPYATYQTRTERSIPVVALEPVT